MTKHLSFIFLTSVLLFGLSACNSGDKTTSDATTDKAAAKAADAISVEGARIRALPPGQRVTAMYMQLKNNSSTKQELIRVESDISQMLELHTHTNNDGVMEMGEVESIPVEANKTADIRPGSYHVMIMGLKKDLQLGEIFDFKLIFKDGSVIPMKAEVKAIEVN